MNEHSLLWNKSHDADWNKSMESIWEATKREPQWDEDKNWGRVWHRFYDDHVGESLLEVISGQRCSMHYHKHRWNTFICIDAMIVVEDYGPKTSVDPYESQDMALVRLSQGRHNSFTVAPNRWHLFKVIKPGRIVEIYYTIDGTPVDPDDIVRFDVGTSFDLEK